MAASSRNERQLMRQRGAGTRDVESVNFALDFGSHGSREERQLMRRRGAGNRKIDDVDFGFAFATPGSSRRSASKTPQSSRRPASRSSKTPGSRGSRERSTMRSVRRGSASAAHRSTPPADLINPVPLDATVAEISAKRRKLGPGDEPTSRRTSGRRKTSGAVFTIAEEPENHATQPGSTANTPIPDLPSIFGADGDKENQTTEASEQALVQKSIYTRSNSTRRRTRSSLNVLEDSVATSIEEAQEPSFAQRAESESAQAVEEHNAPSKEKGPVQTIFRPSSTTAPTKRRRKRKTVVLGRKKRRSSGNDSVQSNSFVEEEVAEAEPEEELSANAVEEEPLTSHLEETEEFEDDSQQSLLLDQPTLPQQERTKRRGRLSISVTPAAHASEDEEEDGTYVYEEHTPDPRTPAPKKKVTNKRRTSAVERPTGNKKRKSNAGSTFPITTHRLTNIHALPTISEEEEADQGSDDEHRGKFENFKDRAVPNAVDVLAQICREMVDNTIEQLKPQPGSKARRGEITAKQKALQAFGEELDKRLFDMSEAVEYRLTLEARLRKSKREKADLQAQWIDVRRQRDEIGLRADAIRRQNWLNEEISKQQWEASKLAQQTELSLESEASEEGLEFLLRSVAGRVSSTGSNCGVLDRVKSFNAQLERVAMLLERR